MNIPRATLLSLSFFALTACGSTPTKSVATVPAKPVLSAAAQQSLAQADADVQAAKSRFALWTTTASAYQAAQEAALAGDSAAVIKQASFASSQAKLGLEQLSYLGTEAK